MVETAQAEVSLKKLVKRKSEAYSRWKEENCYSS
jgi:hypothetical protein